MLLLRRRSWEEVGRRSSREVWVDGKDVERGKRESVVHRGGEKMRLDELI